MMKTLEYTSLKIKNLLNYLKTLLKDSFRFSLVTILTILFFAVFFGEQHKPMVPTPDIEGIHIFIHPDCPHCHKAMNFIDEELQPKYPEVRFYIHNIAQQEELNLLLEYANKMDISLIRLGTPTIFTEDEVIIGFKGVETTGKQLEAFAQQIQSKQVPVTERAEQPSPLSDEERYLDLPIFGEVDVLNTSLPILTIILGLVDGFNPCAMWVLVYLISVIAGLKDQRKIWFLVGSFVLSSGILYFLFMTAWLNAFLFIGYVRALSLLVGIIALYMGIINVREYIITKGNIQCKLTDNKTRKETMSRVRDLVNAPLSMFSIVGIIMLAFIVNSIEFVCSAALPAIYTYVLTQANLSIATYYLYIFAYTIFFMLDDFIVFSVAAFAIHKYMGTKYLKYSTVIGGTVMIVIGIFLVFFPEYLR